MCESLKTSKVQQNVLSKAKNDDIIVDLDKDVSTTIDELDDEDLYK